MGSKIPDSFNLDVDLDVFGPVELSGIPTSFSVDITHLPKIQLGIDPLTINPLTINPLTINPLTINPLDLSLRIKEFPSIRGHIPANFTVGLSILGLQLLCLKLCGEAQVITEPYHPNPCEHCGTVTTRPPGGGSTVPPTGVPGTPA